MEQPTRSFFSGRIHIVLAIVAAILLAALIFHAGVVVGSRGGFSRGAFGPRDEHRFRFSPFGISFPRGFIENGHGAVGTVTDVSLPIFTVKTRGGTSQTVAVGTTTVLRSGGAPASTSTLRVGVPVVIIGEPDGQGRLTAFLIRIINASSTPSL